MNNYLVSITALRERFTELVNDLYNDYEDFPPTYKLGVIDTHMKLLEAINSVPRAKKEGNDDTN